MNIQDVATLLTVYAIIAVTLAVALRLNRTGSRFDPRKVVHIGIGMFVLVWWAFSANWIMLVFITVPVAAVLFVAMFKGNAVSDSELGDIANNKGHRTGLFLYVVSINILVALFFGHWTAATVGVVAMTLGDGCGSLVGRRFGRHPIVNGKSLEGSLAVFLATAIGTVLIVTYYGWLVSAGFYPTGDATAIVPVWALGIIAGAIASVLEAVCPGEYDNIVMPLAVASAMALLGL